MQKTRALSKLLSGLAIVLLVSHALADGAGEQSGKYIQVDLDRQVLMAYEDDNLVHEFHAVTGSCAKWTHPGTYQIDRKVEDYVSQTYDVEMPYTMFFTDDGKAIHGTSFATIRSFLHAYVSDNVGSKGCVGISNSNARTMFEWAPVGTPVVILRSERNPDEKPGFEG